MQHSQQCRYPQRQKSAREERLEWKRRLLREAREELSGILTNRVARKYQEGNSGAERHEVRIKDLTDLIRDLEAEVTQLEGVGPIRAVGTIQREW